MSSIGACRVGGIVACNPEKRPGLLAPDEGPWGGFLRRGLKSLSIPFKAFRKRIDRWGGTATIAGIMFRIPNINRSKTLKGFCSGTTKEEVEKTRGWDRSPSSGNKDIFSLAADWALLIFPSFFNWAKGEKKVSSCGRWNPWNARKSGMERRYLWKLMVRVPRKQNAITTRTECEWVPLDVHGTIYHTIHLVLSWFDHELVGSTWQLMDKRLSRSWQNNLGVPRFS